jgi:hypothetical protein
MSLLNHFYKRLSNARRAYPNFPIHLVGNQKLGSVEFFGIVRIAGLEVEVENAKQIAWFVGFYVLEDLGRNRDQIFPKIENGFFSKSSVSRFSMSRRVFGTKVISLLLR